MKKILFILAFITLSLFAKEYSLNIQGNEEKEVFSVNINFETEESGKIQADQRVDIRNLSNFKSLKVLTASGLKGTLKDEREVLVYYKTSLDVSGLKIRNLYKVAHARIYQDENNISINFDPDHYQNIISYLRYHNIKADVIKDINNMYGTWNEIE
jgi:competence protein ComGF